MRQSKRKSAVPSFGDLLVLDRLVTGPIVNLMYWAGLGCYRPHRLLVIGASVGVAIREGLLGWLLALPALVIGLLFVVMLAAIWRGFCEFYLVIFRISEDLRAIRQANEADRPESFPPNG